MKTPRLFNNPIFVLILIVSLVSLACGGTTPTSEPPDSTTTTTSNPQPQPSPHPEPGVEEFMRELDMSQLAMAVMLPYGGQNPDAAECGLFWNHQAERHLPGGEAISQHTEQEIMDFLSAVGSNDPKATLIRVAYKTGDGLASLWRFAGRQWLFFIGNYGTPSAFRPVDQNAVRAAIHGNTSNNPNKNVRASMANSARCFKEAAPEWVTVNVEVEVKVSEFNGIFEPGITPMPIPGATATAPIPLTPEAIGSYGLVPHLSGTPSPMQLQDFVYDPGMAAWVYDPAGGWGLTPAEMAEVVMLTGATVVVIGSVIVLVAGATVTVPVVVLVGGSVAPALQFAIP